MHKTKRLMANVTVAKGIRDTIMENSDVIV